MSDDEQSYLIALQNLREAIERGAGKVYAREAKLLLAMLEECRWIPLSELWPVIGSEIIVANGDGEVWAAKAMLDRNGDSYFDPYGGSPVTHWRPFPPAPAVEGKGGQGDE